MHSYVVVVNDKYRMRIAPLELQIAYKLWLGSEKDIGDAVFLYELFKTAIDHNELRKWCSRLDVNMEVLLS